MRQRGFTLVEVLVAIAVFAAAALATGHLLVLTTHAMRHSRAQTTTTALAVARMEELRALAWTFDANGAPESDQSTDLSVSPPARNGTGLLPSADGALDENTVGFADFLDERGEWIGSGTEPPPRAVFVRRWSIVRADGASPDTLIIQVLVRNVVDDRRSDGRAVRGASGEARLATVKTRTAR